MSTFSDDPDPLPLALVVPKKVYPGSTLSKLEPDYEPRKRLKLSDDRVTLEGRAEEILVEIEPDIEVDNEPTQNGDRRKSDQVNIFQTTPVRLDLKEFILSLINKCHQFLKNNGEQTYAR